MPEPKIFHNRLNGYHVIVTGAGSLGDGVGTGKAIASLFAREGAKVALLDLDKDRAEETLAMISKNGGTAMVFIGDVTDPDDCLRMVDEATNQFGNIDVLINNVGLGAGSGRLEDIPPETWAKGIDLNLNSAFYMSRAAIPTLLNSNGKAIINIASVAGVRAHGSGSYGSAKAALIQFTRELAVIYGAEGLRANSVVPGHIMTPLVEKFSSPEARDTRRNIAPLKLEGDAWDVAQAALFLAGSESRFITGAAIPVDGGVTQIAPLAAFEAITGSSASS